VSEAGDRAPELRLDKWLWAARFFKTRSAAATAVSGGKVEVDGDRAKPSRRVRSGTRLAIRRGEVLFEVVVKAVNEQRRPASEAVLLYEETPESVAARTAETARRAQAERRRQLRLGRPERRERRELSRLKGH
jgi:ribosome-associated heat shock protein Hsp15